MHLVAHVTLFERASPVMPLCAGARYASAVACASLAGDGVPARESPVRSGVLLKQAQATPLIGVSMGVRSESSAVSIWTSVSFRIGAGPEGGLDCFALLYVNQVPSLWKHSYLRRQVFCSAVNSEVGCKQQALHRTPCVHALSIAQGCRMSQQV